MQISQSTGCPLFPKDKEPNGDAVKISGGKRSTPEYPSNSPQNQCSGNNPGNGHVVYVRRKAEAESGRSTGSDNQSSRPDSPHVKKPSEHNETNQQKANMKEPKNFLTEVLSTSRASATDLPATKTSVSPSLARSNKTSTIPNTALHITSMTSLLADPNSVDIKYLHERYSKLQNLLKEMEQSNQNDYIHMLRSLSSVELSRHAVELEKRCIQLSLEEGKELQRVGMLDVLGRHSKN